MKLCKFNTLQLIIKKFTYYDLNFLKNSEKRKEKKKTEGKKVANNLLAL